MTPNYLHQAQMVKSAGRGGDIHLIHVNDDELRQMHQAWGEPSINPATGLPEYGFFSRLKHTADFMHHHVRNILHGARNALTGHGSIFGGTPLGTKLSNAVTGRHDKPITDQYGGPTDPEKSNYIANHGGDPNSLGYAPQLHAIGSAIGSYYAGNYAGGQLGHLFSGAGQAAGDAASTAGSTAGTTAGTAAGDAALPEIVVTGTRGLTAGQVAAGLGAGAGGLGSVYGQSTQPAQPQSTDPSNYGDYGGLNTNSDPVGSFGRGIGTGSNAGDLAGGASSGAGMGWGDWVNLAGQIYGAYEQGRGATDAARASAAGDQAAINEQRREFDTIIGLQKPYADLGSSAIGQIGRLYGYNTGANGGPGAPDMSGFFTSPDYNFRRTEGTRGIENLFSAKGGAQSGNALRALADYNSNLAAGEYGNYYNRLAGQAGIGQTATNAGSQAAMATGSNVSNLLSDQGNARASGIEGRTNALTGGISDLLSWYNRRRYGGG